MRAESQFNAVFILDSAVSMYCIPCDDAVYNLSLLVTSTLKSTWTA